MDMEQAFEVKLDKTVTLDDAPTSGEHYLKQVALDRLNQPKVVVASTGLSKLKSKAVPIKLPATLLSDLQKFAEQQVVVPVDWQRQQIADFSELRERLSLLRDHMQEANEIPVVSFPEMSNSEAWKIFCFRKRCSLFTPIIANLRASSNCAVTQPAAVQMGNSDAEVFVGSAQTPIQSAVPTVATQSSKGTPPYLRLVLALTQTQLVQLLDLHVAWLSTDYDAVCAKADRPGIPLDRAQWLFSLLALLEKPLAPDTCSTLREFARLCIAKRSDVRLAAQSAVAANDGFWAADEFATVFRSFSWFICIIAHYFDQSDLSDA